MKQQTRPKSQPHRRESLSAKHARRVRLVAKVCKDSDTVRELALSDKTDPQLRTMFLAHL